MLQGGVVDALLHTAVAYLIVIESCPASANTSLLDWELGWVSLNSQLEFQLGASRRSYEEVMQHGLTEAAVKPN